MVKKWNDLTIGQYRQIVAIEKEDSELKAFEVAGVLMGKSVEEILNTPIDEVNKTLEIMNSLTRKPEIGELKKKYVLNNKTYKVMKNLKEMTTAQYIDFENYAQDMGENIDKVLSVFLIPEGKTYTEGYDVFDVINDINNYMTVEDGLSLAGFFFKQYKSSTRDMLFYLDAMMKTQARRMPKEVQAKVEMARTALRSLRDLEMPDSSGLF